MVSSLHLPEHPFLGGIHVPAELGVLVKQLKTIAPVLQKTVCAQLISVASQNGYAEARMALGGLAGMPAVTLPVMPSARSGAIHSLACAPEVQR